MMKQWVRLYNTNIISIMQFLLDFTLHLHLHSFYLDPFALINLKSIHIHIYILVITIQPPPSFTLQLTLAAQVFISSW